nr:coproporphyrinogen dehydrogenase HemZ [Vallitaleaceae bacterium]
AGSAIGRKMPWGVLTGIRPTKLVYQLIRKHGKKRDVIAEILHREYKIAKDKVSLLLDIVGFDGEIINGLEDEGVNLYIGIPFCPSKCAYCSFTSYPIDTHQNLVESYLEVLKTEMRYVGKHIVKDRPITTIYIGGGTPTALSQKQLKELMVSITTIFDTQGIKEFTVEAGRPDTIDADKLSVLKAYGVDRISINPQTMNQDTLDLIGRDHTTLDIEEAYNIAKSIGFKAINMDLILGLPGESRIDVLSTLEAMWHFKVENITVHTLAVKKGSELMDKQANYHMASALEVEEMLQMSRIQLELMGLKPYYMYRQKHTLGNFENVGYTKEGLACLYNMIMIEEVQTVIAMGAGSISKFVYRKNDEPHFERIENVKNLDEYIGRIDEMIQRKKSVARLHLTTIKDDYK